jgi:hypothetical protein
MISSSLKTRRAFLETAGLAAGALALPGAALAQANGSVSVADLMAEGALPDVWEGSKDAPVTIIEYASMTCSHCAHFHETTYPILKSKYIDTGKVRAWEKGFLEFMRAQFPQVADTVRTSKALSKDMEAELKRGIEQYSKSL